jgi:hypothetical protein
MIVEEVKFEERSFVAALRMTAKGECAFGEVEAGPGSSMTFHSRDYLVELLPFDPMQSDLRPNCAVAQFAKPPTLLRSAEWGTLRGDLWSWQEVQIEVPRCDSQNLPLC